MHRSQLVLVAIGGALGSSARNLVIDAFAITSGAFPTATLTVNVVGALLLGTAHPFLVARQPGLRPLVAVGLLASFTTFSAFAVEIVDLVRLEHHATAATYATLTLLGGVAAAWVGLRAGNAMNRSPANGAG